MTGYTPTTSETRFAVMASALPDRSLAEEAGLAFDRWLADVKANTWDEGRESIQRVINWIPTHPGNPYRRRAVEEDCDE